MGEPRVIALDAMGGDHGPPVIVAGAALSLERHPGQSFMLFGDGDRIEAELAKHQALRDVATIVHTDVAIAMDAKPSQAVRQGRQSSLWLSLQAVRDGDAHVAVSAGNTGALMAMAKLCLRTMSGIERPAIAALWPTVEGECIVLDVGANVGASARQLADFALMGAAMARAVFHIEKPSVGLLNIGVEEIKGVEETKQAHAWLKGSDLPITYRGFIEGDQIGHGVVDVVVTEGYTGNIALKTAEGTAKQVGAYVKSAMSRSWLSRLGAFISQDAFRALREKMDPARVNGGTFLGLNGFAIKSHGGAGPMAFAAAIDLGYEMSQSGLLERLSMDLDAFHDRIDMPLTG
ncbi:MAG: phosphate acyltransferase PlsX [Pseudomonadota bacterium]